MNRVASVSRRCNPARRNPEIDMTRTEFDAHIDELDAAQRIEQLLDVARQLRAAIPCHWPLTDVEVMRADAARMLERAADLLGAARAEETRAA